MKPRAPEAEGLNQVEKPSEHDTKEGGGPFKFDERILKQKLAKILMEEVSGLDEDFAYLLSRRVLKKLNKNKWSRE